MVNRLWSLNLWKHAGRWLAFAGLFLAVGQSTPAQSEPGPAPGRDRAVKERVLPGSYPQKPSLPPLWTIPVEPLGFSPPGPLYLGQRNSLVSLDFIDENRLLFTFRVPGLIRRDLKPGDTADTEERRIRAVVLTLPGGNIEAEGLWAVHDRTRYLWILKDGHFLLRDQNSLQEGDTRLILKPLLQFPGPLFWLELDPTQRFLVSNSYEPVPAPGKAGQADSPSIVAATTPAAATQDSGNTSGNSKGDSSSDDNPEPTDTVVRILHLETGQVMLVSRARAAVHLPINSDGYLESLRGRGGQWVVNLNFFSGGSKFLGNVESTCAPNIEFITQQEMLATGCTGSGSHRLVAMTTDGKTLWDDLNPDTSIWPVLAHSASGERVMQETFAVTHPVSAYMPLGSDDIKGQVVRVFNAATGEVVFEAPASPVFDAGGNAAISPSGRRVAILNAGAIQIFELPAPLSVPVAAAKQSAH
jgi:hypothetical protein